MRCQSKEQLRWHRADKWCYKFFLDQQTQQNAAIASQTHDVAVIIDEIEARKLVVSKCRCERVYR